MMICQDYMQQMLLQQRVRRLSMSSSTLKTVLLEYERKRDAESKAARERKEFVYSQNSRLQEIDEELSRAAIETSKSLLTSQNNSALLTNLNRKIKDLKKEKKEILKRLNIDESYFKPKYDCKHCKDTGYVTSGYITSMCKCLEQKLFDIEYNKFNVYSLQNQSFDKFNINFYSDEVNKEKYKYNISPRNNMSRILKICEKFIENFDNINEKNLLFTGNSGLGKTFLSNCIANKLLKSGKTVLYQTAPVMLDTIIDYRMRKIIK